MNIFILDRDPVKAAQMQCDKHIVKMPLESAQMLSTAHRMLDGELHYELSTKGRKVKRYRLPDDREDKLYKAVHFNHPCTAWTMLSNNNYNWHFVHFQALSEEFKYRFGKDHSSWTDLNEILSMPPRNIPIGYKTQPPLAMGSNPECMFEDVVKSYRAFYQTKQKRFTMSWRSRPVPDWFQFI